ncbi:MAG: hypothetical protein R6U39_06145, partial [Candidatus Aegiribacteria sp.]
MRCVFFVLLLASAAVLAAGSVSSWQSFGGAGGEAPALTLLESDQNHMVLEISLRGFNLDQRPADGDVWNVVSLPECYPQGEVGLPALPSITEMFALPFGTEAV